MFFLLNKIIWFWFLDGCDGCQGLFDLIVVLIDVLVFFATTEVPEAVPDGRVSHEVHKRTGSVVSQLPKQWRLYKLNLFKKRNIVLKMFLSLGLVSTALRIPGGFVRAILTAEWLSNILSRGCEIFSTHFCLSKITK